MRAGEGNEGANRGKEVREREVKGKGEESRWKGRENEVG